MKKYTDSQSKENYRLLTTASIVCIALCFTMLITIISIDPVLRPVSVDDYNYSKINVSSNPTTSETSTVSKTTNGTESISYLININTAPKQELMQLDGIGEARADAIINYRETISTFKSIEQIMEVDGIGQKTFDKIYKYITV